MTTPELLKKEEHDDAPAAFFSRMTITDEIKAENGEKPSLNINDALGYLDAVKQEFHDQPFVQHQFMEAMKTLSRGDVPTVITRVSQLFYGHNELLLGFNAFLPEGYKIRCDAGAVTFSMPQGRSATVPPPSVIYPKSETLPAPSQSRTSLELNRAFQFLQNVKARCGADTYQKVLDVLSQYHQGKQAESSATEVQTEVARLLKNEPDLCKEFHEIAFNDAPAPVKSEREN